MSIPSITIELTPLDMDHAAGTLEKLAAEMRKNPDAREWEVHDIEGSAVAERNRDEEEA